MPQSEVTSSGLKRELQNKGYKKPQDSIPEFIWNGFDAGASIVEILFERNELGGIKSISVIDNGSGIEDPQRFRPIFESGKKVNPDIVRASSHQHGLNGLGRLTFFTFSHEAAWKTIFKNPKNGLNYKYEIYVSSDDLLEWNPTDIDGNKIVDWAPEKLTESSEQTGTRVDFTVLIPSFGDFTIEEIVKELKNVFAWYLELNKTRRYSLKIDGVELDYSENILQSSLKEVHQIDGYEFEISFILWKSKQKGEYSKYYLLDSDGVERFNTTTTLNNKGDDFFHSLYIKSSFFDAIPVVSLLDHVENSGNEAFRNLTIYNDTEEEKTYKKLLKFVEKYLHDKRKPFIAQAADNLVNEYEEKGIFPNYREDDEWELHRKHTIRTIVRQLYKVQPQIFTKLNVDNRKIFVRFLDLIERSGERDKILSILNEVISLDAFELEQLEKTLKTSKLSNVVKAIQMIEDRYKVVDSLKKIVYEKKLKANECDHLQKIVESHYWLFGEKYHLVSAEEPNFEQALRGYVQILTKGDVIEENAELDLTIDHQSKRKQMDIFMCRQNKRDDSIDHIVVELKHPQIKIGKEQLDQVKEYMSVILKTPLFNANNSSWEFYLVGSELKDYIEGEMENSQNNGEKSLVFKRKNYKIYVKTWSEIFNEFDIRHGFLQDRLKIERHRLLEEEEKEEQETANAIIRRVSDSSAALPEAIVKSKKQRKASG